MELSEFGPRAKTQQPGREAGGENGGLTSELLRRVVQVPRRRLHHTTVIHQPEGQGSSISGTEKIISPGIPPSGQGIPGQWGDLQKYLSIADKPPHYQVFPFPGTTVKRQGLLGVELGEPQKKHRDTPSSPTLPPPTLRFTGPELSREGVCLQSGL